MEIVQMTDCAWGQSSTPLPQWDQSYGWKYLPCDRSQREPLDRKLLFLYVCSCMYDFTALFHCDIEQQT